MSQTNEGDMQALTTRRNQLTTHLHDLRHTSPEAAVRADIAVLENQIQQLEMKQQEVNANTSKTRTAGR